MVFVTEKVFNYFDYRDFLTDTFNQAKESSISFSHRKFAQAAGFKSHNFIPYVLKGARNLTDLSVEKLTKAMSMKSLEGKYFQNMVFYNQAESNDKKEGLYKELLRLKGLSSFHNPNEHQYKYFEKWYYPVIKEFIEVSKWSGDYEELTSIIHPKISLREAKDAIKVLLEIDFIEKREDIYVANHTIIDSEHVPIFIKSKGRKEVLECGIKILEELPPQERYCSHSTISMSREMYDKCNEKYELFVRDIFDMISKEDENNKQNVYQMIHQLFPGTKQNN